MKNEKGFTLIEVIIVVVIVAILASIAIPAYFDQVSRAKRTDATNSLLSTAQALERCFTTNNTYAGCLSGDTAFPITVNSTSAEGYYSIVTTVATATSYSLTATPPVGSSQAGDTDCASFTLTQTGLETAEDSGGADAPNCW